MRAKASEEIEGLSGDRRGSEERKRARKDDALEDAREGWEREAWCDSFRLLRRWLRARRAAAAPPPPPPHSLRPTLGPTATPPPAATDQPHTAASCNPEGGGAADLSSHETRLRSG